MSRHAGQGRDRQRGIVMPVVLIFLMLITGLVLRQIERGVRDEMMASNVREIAVSDNAAQTVLRWCEGRLVNAPLTTITIDAPLRGAAAAWTVSANWANDNTLRFTNADMPGVTDARCLIERSDAELMSPMGDTGNPADPTGRERWMKFRVTARIQRPSGAFDFAQSELRLMRN